MNLDAIASGATVFIDANIFIYGFAPDPVFGPQCRQLFERLERDDLHGITSSSILSDVTHRLMCLEACGKFGWSYTGIARQLKKHPHQVQKLTGFRHAIESIEAIKVQILPTYARHVFAACQVSQQHGLLSNDALIVAILDENKVSQIASNDADFDRVPGITRYAPV